MLERYLLVWLCGSSLLAYAWPSDYLRSFSSNRFLLDPFAEGVPSLPYVICITMFCIGWLLPRDEINQLVKKWPMVFLGTLTQYASMPLLAFLIANSLPLSDDQRIGLIMVGCVPGAMASNVLTMMARGNVSYSVSLTTLATLLSPFLVPLLLYGLLGRETTIDIIKQFKFLMLTVVLPTILGHLCGRKEVFLQARFSLIAKAVASLAILWIIAVVVGKNRDQLASGTSTIVVAVLLLNLSGYAAGILAGRGMKMPSTMRRALALEIGMQNAGLGSTLASVIFVDRPAVLIPTAMYTFGCMLTGIVLARFWMRRSAD